jgi:hypothetical protein
MCRLQLGCSTVVHASGSAYDKDGCTSSGAGATATTNSEGDDERRMEEVDAKEVSVSCKGGVCTSGASSGGAASATGAGGGESTSGSSESDRRKEVSPGWPCC